MIALLSSSSPVHGPVHWLPFFSILLHCFLSAKMSDRQMKYPYTLTAKIGQFPWKHHFTGHWIYKYYAFGILASVPVFMWLSNSINSPGNIKKYEDQMAKEAAAHGHH